MRCCYHKPETNDGWRLDLCQSWDPRSHRPELRPCVLFPGYGMNAFPLGYHPAGMPLVASLAQAGFEVWTANLRGQGASSPARKRSRSSDYGFRELALTDIPCVFATVREETRSSQTAVNAIGCSLGATYLYTYLAHHPQDHAVGALVAVGGPLRWDRIHPVMRIAFASPFVAGLLPTRGVRRLARFAARFALPLAERVPSLLGFYMNADMVDLTCARELIRTVEDPSRQLNREIATWIRHRELHVDGRSVTEGLRGVSVPILCVLANRDGVVPAAAARSITGATAGEVDLLEVGDDDRWFAHADLFVSRLAKTHVFEPIATWLAQRS